MRTITRAAVPADQIDTLAAFAQRAAGPELQELLESVVRCLRDGDEIVAYDPQGTLTPNQAAKHLEMSRTHLYKLLDDDVIPSYRVGRDRRIRMRDIVRFESQRQNDRRELAERFANQDQTRNSAIDELAELI